MVTAIALIVVACGSNPPPSPQTAAPPSESPSAPASASPSPSASPSASASASASVDVGAALVTKLTSISLFAKTTIGGELDSGPARYAVLGSYDVAGVAHHTVFTVQSPGGLADESIYADGTMYHRTGTGPWYVKPPTLSVSDVSAFLRTVKTLQETGVESKNGQQLHHLTASLSLPPAALGLTDPSITGTAGSIEFWADDAGTPAVMTAKSTWKQTASGAPVDVALTIDFTFSDFGTSFAIAAPEEIWTTYTSSLNHMTFGYPVDWDLFKAKGKIKYDEVSGPAAAYADFSRYASRGFTLNQLVRLISANPDRVQGFHVDSAKTVKMAGLAGRQMLIHATVQGKKRYWIFTFVLKGSYFYEVDLFDNKGHEKDDLILANQIVSTIVLH
jgi:hypothetical protein